MIPWLKKLKKPKAEQDLTVTAALVALLRLLIRKGVITEQELVDATLKAKDDVC